MGIQAGAEAAEASGIEPAGEKLKPGGFEGVGRGEKDLLDGDGGCEAAAAPVVMVAPGEGDGVGAGSLVILGRKRRGGWMKRLAAESGCRGA